MSVLIFLDGVLRKTHDKSPIFEGLNLYKGLNEVNRVLVLVDDQEKAELWFKANTLNAKLDDIMGPSKIKSDNPKLQQVLDCQSKGKIDLVVTEDSDLAKDLLERGFTTLIFISPKYSRPEFRPDSRSGIRSWTQILGELDRQKELYNEDVRLQEEDPSLYSDEEEPRTDT
jgi:hypothetical protein